MHPERNCPGEGRTRRARNPSPAPDEGALTPATAAIARYVAFLRSELLLLPEGHLLWEEYAAQLARLEGRVA